MNRAVPVQKCIEFISVYESMIERKAFGVDGNDHPLLKATTLYLSVLSSSQSVISHVGDKKQINLLGGDWGYSSVMHH